jgi:hypothetical protein
MLSEGKKRERAVCGNDDARRLIIGTLNLPDTLMCLPQDPAEHGCRHDSSWHRPGGHEEVAAGRVDRL